MELIVLVALNVATWGLTWIGFRNWGDRSRDASQAAASAAVFCADAIAFQFLLSSRGLAIFFSVVTLLFAAAALWFRKQDEAERTAG